MKGFALGPRTPLDIGESERGAGWSSIPTLGDGNGDRVANVSQSSPPALVRHPLCSRNDLKCAFGVRLTLDNDATCPGWG